MTLQLPNADVRVAQVVDASFAYEEGVELDLIHQVFLSLQDDLDESSRAADAVGAADLRRTVIFTGV